MPFLPAPVDDVTLTRGLAIHDSVKVVPKVYSFPNSDDNFEKSVLTVAGRNIVVDFGGATLEGSPETAAPDKRQGLGLLVTGENVTIRNLKIRGYKIGFLARNCPGLKLYNCDFSYNWKQHLMSTQEREDESDWQSYHHNENHEWYRYGAGAYLDGCDNFEVKNLHVTGGQCGLMLTKCNNGLVWNCVLSFNSGLGLGMYRSSGNKIMHNKMDWCVRGYSHGVYNRGQDSAGILVFEQCNQNIFAYNSATHGGDGFFLWAGQQTMDSGEGGCNDNLLYGNDLSDSPCNAIEATFSRNQFVNNLLSDSWHGVWGGYSYGTPIIGNQFGLDGEAIAIEHGQKNTISFNKFGGDSVGVFLWQDAGQPDPSWGYPKHRDVRNVGTVVEHNVFLPEAEHAILLGSGFDVTLRQNLFMGSKGVWQFDGEQSNTLAERNVGQGPKDEPAKAGVTYKDNLWNGIPGELAKPWMSRGGNSVVANEPDGPDYLKFIETSWSSGLDIPKRLASNPSDELKAALLAMEPYYVKPATNGMDAFIPKGTLRGRKYILVDEWGPYDFRRPLIWLRKKPTPDTLSFEILGPKGKWRATDVKGLTLSSQSGSVPGTVTATVPKGSDGNYRIQMAYVGGETVDARGVVTAAGKPVVFGWSKVFIPIDWDVKFWAWDDSSDPRTKTAAFAKVLAGKPLAEYKSNELFFATGGSPREGVPADHFTTSAEGSFMSPGGDMVVNITCDDGARVWVDDRLVIDEWHYQGPTLYTKELKLAKGKHSIRVAHFEIDGYTELKVEVKPKG